jgi:tetratricopeptide (TPR) repeat protein
VEAERLRPLHDRPSAALRSTFIAARLLESLGHLQEAEALFDAVVADELDQGHFKDAVLDLVYIFGFHLRLGSSDRAADFGLRALRELDRRDAPANEQCRSVLAQLIEAARGQCLDEGRLRSAREYLRIEWNRSLPAAPMPAGSGERVKSSPNRPAIPHNSPLVEPLLAKALWARLWRETRREQHARVARSPEYHNTAFVELLLTGVRQASSREGAEFTASLALQAIGPMDAPSLLKQDLKAQLWTEVANVRRVASEWSKASAALLQARKHLGARPSNP